MEAGYHLQYHYRFNLTHQTAQLPIIDLYTMIKNTAINVLAPQNHANISNASLWSLTNERILAFLVLVISHTALLHMLALESLWLCLLSQTYLSHPTQSRQAS